MWIKFPCYIILYAVSCPYIWCLHYVESSYIYIYLYSRTTHCANPFGFSARQICKKISMMPLRCPGNSESAWRQTRPGADVTNVLHVNVCLCVFASSFTHCCWPPAVTHSEANVFAFGCLFVLVVFMPLAVLTFLIWEILWGDSLGVATCFLCSEWVYCFLQPSSLYCVWGVC